MTVRVLLGIAVALTGCAVGVLMAQTAPNTFRRRNGTASQALIVLAAGLGALSQSSPTGVVVVNLAIAGGFTAMAAWAGQHVAHRKLALGCVLAAVALGLAPFAALGAGAAVSIVLLRARLPLLKGAALTLVTLGLLQQIGPAGGSWSEAIAFAILLWLAGAGASRASSRAYFAYRVGLGLVLGFVVVASSGFLVAAVPAAGELRQAVRLTEGARGGLTGAATSDARSSLALASRAFAAADSRLTHWSARLVDAVPGVAQNAGAVRSLARGGANVAEAAAGALDTTGLTIGDGGIDLGQVADASDGVDRTLNALMVSLDDLRSVDSPSLVPPVRKATVELRDELVDAAPGLERVARALDLLPGLLGSDGPRRWFLALQTPAESRATGGIIGAFAEIETNRGALTLTRTGRSEELNSFGDPKARQVTGADEYLTRYGRFTPLETWQNLTLSPDFPTVAGVIDQLYPQAGGSEIGGVIALDPFALADILKATGPIDVAPWPVPITSDNAVSILLHEQYLFFPNPDRIEFVADVTAGVFARLTGPGVSVPKLAAALADSVSRRNLILWSPEATEQSLFSDIGASGAMPEPNGDTGFLSVITQNSAGNKIDWFLHRKTSYDVTFDPDLGRVRSQLNLELTNLAPTRGLPNYVIGSSGPRGSGTSPGENRMLVSIYTPLELQHATIDAQPLQLEPAEELGYNVYSGFITVSPGSTMTVGASFDGLVDGTNDAYPMRLRHQVLPNAEQAKVDVGFVDGWEQVGLSGLNGLLTEDWFSTTRFRRKS